MANECNCRCTAVGGKVCFDECQINRIESFRYNANLPEGTTADIFRFKACGVAYDCSSPIPSGFPPGIAIEDCTANVKATIYRYDLCNPGFTGVSSPTLLDEDLPMITGIPLTVVGGGRMSNGRESKIFCADITYIVTGVETLYDPFAASESEGWPTICYSVQTEINCSTDPTPLPLAPDNSNDPCRGCQTTTIICISRPPTVDWFGWPPGDFVGNHTDTNYVLVSQKVQEIQNTYPEQPGVYQGGYLNTSGLDLV